MKKITPVEWQTFSQKKDVESILKILNTSNTFQLTAYAEVALVVFGVALSNIFTDNSIQRKIWIGILILSIIIVFIPFLIWVFKKHCEKKNNSNLINPKNFIDSFDNDICFYILTAESYHSMFIEAIDDETISKEVKRFYFIETSYYLNKAIMTLLPIYNMSNKVIGHTIEEVVSKRLISISRYCNACNLIEEIYTNLNCKVDILDGLKDKKLISDSNKHYCECLQTIKQLVTADVTE